MTDINDRKRESERENSSTRRNYLRAVGAVSVSSLGVPAFADRGKADSSLPNVLTIEGSNVGASYKFTVSGDVEKSTANGASINRNDEISGTTVTGEVEDGTDSYGFSGELTDIQVDGDATVYRNGEQLQLLSNILSIEGSGSEANYEFTVSGDVEKSTANGASINRNDEISGSTVTGEVIDGSDSYAFSDELIDIQVDGDATVYRNGEQIQLLSNVLTIEGSGSEATYEFTVSGDVEKSTANGASINRNDEISGSTVTGEVIDKADSYTFSGELTDIQVDGDATVYRNGEQLQLLSNILTIEGSGSEANYEFTVSGDVEKSTANGASINRNDEISGSTVTGEVIDGSDSYGFSGEITRFDLYGDANVYLNNKKADPDSLGNEEESTDLRLGYNARTRSHKRGNTYEDFADLNGWQAERGRLVSNDDWDGNDGGSATLVGTTSENPIRMATDLTSENFAYRDPSVAVRLRGPAHETLRVELWADTSDDQFITSRYLSEKHGWVRLPISPTAITGDPDLADVDRVTVECYTSGKDIRIDIDDIRTTRKRDNGAVLFIFDDGNETDYTIAYDELAARGWAGSSAVIPGLIDGQRRLSRAQMDEMHADGWAFPNHPQGDTPADGLGSIPGDRVERIMRENKRWLLDNGYERGADTIVWPFGDFDREALQIAGNYYRLAWGGGSSTANGVVTEAGWVPRVELNETDDVANALDAIDYAHRTDTVLSFMTHGMGGNNIGRADFNRLLDRVAFRDLDVLTTADFAAEQ
jgi:hypothetical protein